MNVDTAVTLVLLAYTPISVGLLALVLKAGGTPAEHYADRPG